MNNRKLNKVYLVDSGDILKRCNLIRKHNIKARTDMFNLSQSYGAVGYTLDSDGRLFGLSFTDEPHDQFVVSEYSNDVHVPKEGSQALKDFDGTMPLASVTNMFKGQYGFPMFLSTQTQGMKLSDCDSPIKLLWRNSSSKMFIRIPDIKAYVSYMRVREPNAVFEHDGDKWEVPKGLKEVGSINY